MAVEYPECAAPNMVSELVYELCINEQMTEDDSNKIAGICEALANELVTFKGDDPGYM
jgi:hypothetical protein